MFGLVAGAGFGGAKTVDIADRVKWAAWRGRLRPARGRPVSSDLNRMRAAARDLEPRRPLGPAGPAARWADDLPRQQSELAVAAILAAQRGGRGRRRRLTGWRRTNS